MASVKLIHAKFTALQGHLYDHKPMTVSQLIAAYSRVSHLLKDAELPLVTLS